MARVPLAPRGDNLVPWAHQVTNRIERDHANIIDRLPVAWVNFASTTGTVVPTTINGFNISTVTRSATGAFRISYITPLNLTRGVAFAGATDRGYITLAAPSDILSTSIKVNSRDPAGTIADVAWISLTIWATNGA